MTERAPHQDSPHKRWPQEHWRVPSKLTLIVAPSVILTLAIIVGALFVGFKVMSGPLAPNPPKHFPSPELNVANDRTQAWRENAPERINEARLRAAMSDVAARGPAAYEPQTGAP